MEKKYFLDIFCNSILCSIVPTEAETPNSEIKEPLLHSEKSLSENRSGSREKLMEEIRTGIQLKKVGFSAKNFQEFSNRGDSANRILSCSMSVVFPPNNSPRLSPSIYVTDSPENLEMPKNPLAIVAEYQFGKLLFSFFFTHL